MLNWTDPATAATLRNLWEVEGLSGSKIAIRMGTTRSGVLGAARRLGLSRRAFPGRPPKDHEPKLRKPSPPKTVDRIKLKGRAVTRIRAVRAAMFDKDAPRVIVQGEKLPTFREGYMGQQGRVSLLDLKDHHCRFPIDCADGETRSCGLDRHEGSSYCLHHAARCGVTG